MDETLTWLTMLVCWYSGGAAPVGITTPREKPIPGLLTSGDLSSPHQDSVDSTWTSPVLVHPTGLMSLMATSVSRPRDVTTLTDGVTSLTTQVIPITPQTDSNSTPVVIDATSISENTSANVSPLSNLTVTQHINQPSQISSRNTMTGSTTDSSVLLKEMLNREETSTFQSQFSSGNVSYSDVVVIPTHETVLYAEGAYELIRICTVVKRSAVEPTSDNQPSVTKSRVTSTTSRVVAPTTRYIKDPSQDGTEQRYNLVQLLSIAGCAVFLLAIIFLSPYVYDKIILPLLKRKTKKQKMREKDERVGWMTGDLALGGAAVSHKIWSPGEKPARLTLKTEQISSECHSGEINHGMVNNGDLSTSCEVYCNSTAATSSHHQTNVDTSGVVMPSTRRRWSGAKRLDKAHRRPISRSKSLKRRSLRRRSRSSYLYQRSMSVDSMCGNKPTAGSFHSVKGAGGSVEPLLHAVVSKLEALETADMRSEHQETQLDVIREDTPGHDEMCLHHCTPQSSGSLSKKCDEPHKFTQQSICIHDMPSPILDSELDYENNSPPHQQQVISQSSDTDI